MSAPSGSGVNNLTIVRSLAWRVYQSTREAPDSFHKIHGEVFALHALLKEVEETLPQAPLRPVREARLQVVLDGCKGVLRDLQDHIRKYNSLSSKAKSILYRMKWSNEDITEIRSRLIANTTMLNSFVSTSQIRVEQRLERFALNIREGKQGSSIVRNQSVESLSANEGGVWQTIRKELEDIGLTRSAFETNREFIFDWFTDAVESGAFQMDEVMSSALKQKQRGSVPTSPVSPASPASPSSLLVLPPPQTPDPLSNRNSQAEIDLTESDCKDYWALPSLSESEFSRTETDDKEDLKLETMKPISKTQRAPSSMTTFFSSMSLSRRRGANVSQIHVASRTMKEEKLSKGGVDIEPSKAESSKQGPSALSELFNSGGIWRLPDKKMINVALFQACKSGSGKALAALMEKGADVNAVDEEGKSALMEAIYWNHEQTVKWLLKHGANPNYRGGSRMTPVPGLLVTATPIGVAVSKRNASIIQILLKAGADVNAQKYPLSVLQEAALMGKPLIVDLLLKGKAKINNYSAEYGTALMLSLRNGKEDVAKLLVEKGARVKHRLDKPTKDGLTSPMEAAIAAEIFSQVHFLVSEIVVVNTAREANELLKWAQLRYKKKSPVSLSDEQSKIVGLLEDLVRQLEDEAG